MAMSAPHSPGGCSRVRASRSVAAVTSAPAAWAAAHTPAYSAIAPSVVGYCTSAPITPGRSEEHTSELQSQSNLVCRLLLEKKKQKADATFHRPDAPTMGGARKSASR